MTIETSDAAKRLEAIAAKHGLTIDCQFVPLSQSRNAGPSPFNGGKPWRGLNWRVRLMRGGAPVGEAFDYSQGEAHCPAYKSKAYSPPAFGKRAPRDRDAAIDIECETGRRARPSMMQGGSYASSQAIPAPSLPDVLSSLGLDAGAIDYATYAGWAADLGMDSDSIAGEAAYRACLATGLLLRSVMGDTGLEELRDAASDY